METTQSFRLTQMNAILALPLAIVGGSDLTAGPVTAAQQAALVMPVEAVAITVGTGGADEGGESNDDGGELHFWRFWRWRRGSSGWRGEVDCIVDSYGGIFERGAWE